jgi:hypothetical protein
MAASTQKQLALLVRAAPRGKAKGCVGGYAAFSEHAPPSERANPLTGSVTSFRIKGDKGFALFIGPHEQKYAMPMVSEAGAWKVTQIQPVPYPPGAPVRGG